MEKLPFTPTMAAPRQPRGDRNCNFHCSELLKFSNLAWIMKYFTTAQGCKYVMSLLCKTTHKCYQDNQKAFHELYHFDRDATVEMQSLEDFTPKMGSVMLENDQYKQIKINIVLTTKSSANAFLFMLKKARDGGKEDIAHSINFVTMYIINEDDSQSFIDVYSQIVEFGIEENKILIVHALTQAKFPFIEKYGLDMDYMVKYRDIHIQDEETQVKYSFDLPDKKMIAGTQALQFLSEKVTKASKKLGNLISKLTVVSADFDDLDTLEVLCGSIKGNFPLISTYEFKTESFRFRMQDLVGLLGARCLKLFSKVSFLGESRLEKDIVKEDSFIFYQKDASSQIEHVHVSNLNIIALQEPESLSVYNNFILMYDAQGVMFTPKPVQHRPAELYFECLKFLNQIEVERYPIIIIPNKNIRKAAWKFTRKQPQILKIYGDEISIRMIDNLPISSSSQIILKPQFLSEISPKAQMSKFEETYFRIYEVISKIPPSTKISLSLEIYKSLKSLRNIIELVSGINLTKLSVFIKSYDYDKSHQDHIFLTKLLKSCGSLEHFKFNGYRFYNLTPEKRIEAKKLIDQYYVQEDLISYHPRDVWDIADF